MTTEIEKALASMRNIINQVSSMKKRNRQLTMDNTRLAIALQKERNEKKALAEERKRRVEKYRIADRSTP